MITFEFQTDESIFAKEGAGDLLAVDATALQVTYLLFPVRLNVNGVEMLEVPPRQDEVVWASRPGQAGLEPAKVNPAASPWLELPLLDVAMVGLDKVRQAASAGTSHYYLGGTGGRLSLEVRSGDVTVRCSLNGRAAAAGYSELVDAWKDFAAQARSLFVRHWPELRRHPIWGEWFSEESS